MSGRYALISEWEERDDGRRWELIPIAEPQTVNLWKHLTQPDQKMSFLVPVTNPLAFLDVVADRDVPVMNEDVQLIVNHREWAARMWVPMVRDWKSAREQGFWVHVRWMEPHAELYKTPVPQVKKIR